MKTLLILLLFVVVAVGAHPPYRDVVIEEPVERLLIASLDRREQLAGHLGDDVLTVAGAGSGHWVSFYSFW